MNDMDDAHRRDYTDKYRMDDLRREIEAFLENAPAGAHRSTLMYLRDAMEDLKADSDYIVRRWD